MSAKSIGSNYSQGYNPSRHAIIVGDHESTTAPSAMHDEMLDRTHRRTSISVPDHLTLTVTVHCEAAEPVSPPVVDEVGRLARNKLVQPVNKGTASAILLALLRIANQTPGNAVAIFPSDHDLTDDRVFMRHVNFAFAAAEARPELTVILGMAALGPECSYGWIEPGPPLSSSDPVRAVRRFVGQATHHDAIDLMRRGALWHSSVTVARVSTLLSLIMIAEPELYSAFGSIRSALGTRGQGAAVERLYAGIKAVDFSSGILAGCPVNLAVLPVNGVAFRNVTKAAPAASVSTRTTATAVA